MLNELRVKRNGCWRIVFNNQLGPNWVNYEGGLVKAFSRRTFPPSTFLKNIPGLKQPLSSMTNSEITPSASSLSAGTWTSEAVTSLTSYTTLVLVKDISLLTPSTQSLCGRPSKTWKISFNKLAFTRKNLRELLHLVFHALNTNHRQSILLLYGLIPIQSCT